MTTGTGTVEHVASVPLKKRAKAVLFVVLAFGFWFLFVSLGRIVMNCAPTFEWSPLIQCAPLDLATIKKMTWSETTMMLVTLVVAIWASRRAVFPPED